jgi:hypothetical protein
MPAQRNDLPFQYQMRGQQMQYLHDDGLAHAIDQRDRDLEDFLGRRRSGDVLWQRCEALQFNATMNGSQDFNYSDPNQYPFATVATFDVSAIYLSPDRATSIGAQVYSNNTEAPQGASGLLYNGLFTTTPGAGWASLGALAPAIQPMTPSQTWLWVLRLYGVSGGPTNYSARYTIRLQRTVA